MGNYTNLQAVLSDAQQDGIHILSLRSSRGRLRREKSDEVSNGTALQRSPSALFLDAYNCDSAGSPKPSWADRARKQIYRTAYVLHHFVHYSTATKGLLISYKESQEQGSKWIKRYQEKPSSETVTNELRQAVMVHTKSITPDMTEKFKMRCRHDSSTKGKTCWVANPWPNGQASEENAYDDTGMKYNCFVNAKVDKYWVPRLQDALAKRQNFSPLSAQLN